MAGMMWVVAVMMGLGATGVNQRPDPKPVVTKSIDANTGLEVRQTFESTVRVTVEVADQKVSIRREHLASGARVTLAGAQGAVTLVLDGQGVTVSGLGGERRLDQSRRRSSGSSCSSAGRQWSATLERCSIGWICG